jgi:hypothetical protein
MPISFTHDYGGFALDRNNHRGVNLVSDGKTLAMRWDQSSFILSAFDISHLEYQESPGDFYTMGGSTRQVATKQEIHLHLVSRGPIKVGPASALDNLFLNANDLSVDELLKLAYQKIDARAEAEESFTNAKEVSL